MARIKVKAAEVEEDVRLQAFDVSIAIGFLDEGLDLVVDALQRPIGDPVREVGQNIHEVPFALARKCSK